MNFQGHDLLYNAAAHFAAMNKYENGILDAIKTDFGAICWALAELSAQAEAMNRYMKRDAKEPLCEERLLVALRPQEIVEAKMAILQAITHGLAPDENPNAEVDLVLEEIQKKTGND